MRSRGTMLVNRHVLVVQRPLVRPRAVVVHQPLFIHNVHQTTFPLGTMRSSDTTPSSGHALAIRPPARQAPILVGNSSAAVIARRNACQPPMWPVGPRTPPRALTSAIVQTGSSSVGACGCTRRGSVRGAPRALPCGRRTPRGQQACCSSRTSYWLVSCKRCRLNDSGVQVRASGCLVSGLDAEHRGRRASAARCVPGCR
jgi:hypothetical protein